ncbi:AfsR/SARP family transcriptional regulator [Kitasatospora sp. NPDC054795]
MTIELRILSTVSCRGEEVTAPGLRGLLALLAREVRGGCGRGSLVDGLWPEDGPERPEKALQVLVSRARAKFGADLIVSTPTGYRLGLGEERVDASAVLLHAAACAEKARAGGHAGALAEAEAGLELWEGQGGPADSDGTDPVSALRVERDRIRRALRRGRALALARTGRHPEAVEALAEEAAGQPRDEEVLLELLRSEARTAGAAAALGRYDRYRRGLRDTLGADPGPELRELHQELLRGEAAPVRRGVPHEPNALVGREADLAAVAELLGTARVVSVVGPGGLGKTRLAAAAARAATQRVVHLVPLAAVAADQDVAGAVAASLGTGDRAGIAGALGPGPVLLVLDNCEQVVRGVADLVRALVAARPDLRVLTTSRTPLGISAEALYPLPELDRAAAVERFAQRARAARPDVELPVGPVAGLCARLDGLPLALELAAARVRVLTVTGIADRLADRFALLRGGPRDAPQRHRTLQAVVDWSWNLLNPPGRAALRALSVFPGGFTAEAAERLLGGAADGTGADVLTVLEDLVDQSLLRLADTLSGGRFRMLETVREFGAAERTKAAEDEAITFRFLSWAREFGIAHHDGPFGPAAVPQWRLVRAEQDNLVRALRLALAAGDGPTVAATAAVLAGLWTAEGNYVRLLALAEDTGGPVSRLVGVVEQGEQAVGEEQGGRGDAGVDQQDDDRDQVVLVQRLLALAGVVHQGGDEVLGALGTAAGDQFPDVVDDADQALDHPAAVAVREVADPVADPGPVGLLDADQLADQVGGQRVGELAQEVGRFVPGGEAGQQLVGGALDEAAQGGDPAGGEGAGQRRAAAGVLPAVEQREVAGEVLCVLGGEAVEGGGRQFVLRVGFGAGRGGDARAVPDQPRFGERGLDVGVAGDQPDRGVQAGQDDLGQFALSAEPGVGAGGVLDVLGGEPDGGGGHAGCSFSALPPRGGLSDGQELAGVRLQRGFSTVSVARGWRPAGGPGGGSGCGVQGRIERRRIERAMRGAVELNAFRSVG